MYATTLAGTRHTFPNLKTVLAAATPARSGDVLAGIGATSMEQRFASRYVIADLPLTTFLTDTVIPYETDETTRLIVDPHGAASFARISHMTVGGLREWLLTDEADTPTLAKLAPGLTPEMVAAVSKLMRNQDLISVARKCA